MNFLKAKNSFNRNSKDNSSVYSNDETLELTAIDKSISRFPESLGRKVVHLNLSQNKIKDIIVSQDIIGLKTLIVSQNLLSSLPSKLSYLQLLQVLDVSHNKISKLPSKLDLPNLKYLDVSNNNLSSLDNDFFCGTPVLKSLDISNNSITFLPRSIAFVKDTLRQLSLLPNPLDATMSDILDHSCTGIPPSVRSALEHERGMEDIRPSYDMAENDETFPEPRLPLPCIAYPNSHSKITGFRLQRILGHLVDYCDFKETLNLHQKLSNYVSCLNFEDLSDDDDNPSTDDSSDLELPIYDFETKCILNSNLPEVIRKMPPGEYLVREFCVSEVDYIEQLNLLKRLYLMPFYRANSLSKSQFRLMYSNIEKIILCHERFYAKLERALDAKSTPLAVICKHFNGLYCYMEYLNNFEAAVDFFSYIYDTASGNYSVKFVHPSCDSNFSERWYGHLIENLTEKEAQRLKKTLDSAKSDSDRELLKSPLLVPMKRLGEYQAFADRLMAETSPNDAKYGLVLDIHAAIKRIMEMRERCQNNGARVAKGLSYLARIKVLESTFNAEYLKVAPLTRRLLNYSAVDVYMLKSTSNGGRNREFEQFSGLEIERRSLGNMVEHRFGSEVIDPEQIKQSLKETKGLAFNDLACLKGEQVRVFLFNDMLLLTAKNTHVLVGIIGLGTLPLKGRHAEYTAISSTEAIMRITDGFTAAVIKTTLDFCERWTESINKL